MNKEHTLKLIDALRSGKYIQCQNALHVGNAFCCLGVACDLVKEELGVTWLSQLEPYGQHRILNETFSLPQQVQELYGTDRYFGVPIECVPNAVLDRIIQSKDDFGEYIPLSTLNDRGVDFATIANILENVIAIRSSN